MNPLHKKIRLQENQIIATVNAPKDFHKVLEPLPKGVRIQGNLDKSFLHLYWFVKSKTEMEAQLPMILKAMKDETMVWAFYPKGTSGIQTDLTRDKGWDALMMRDDLRWISMISYDETWTAFAFRKKTEKDKRLESKPVNREIFRWADSKTKIITLPDDVYIALNKNPKAKSIFDSLAFSHRREYIEWIITAKREETRLKRIEGMMERLLKGWKNPAGN
jgi:hypothetical protein